MINDAGKHQVKNRHAAVREPRVFPWAASGCASDSLLRTGEVRKQQQVLGKDINALRNAEGRVDTVPPRRARRLASGGRPRLFDAAAPGLRGSTSR
jgi:hypothetical protein